MQLAQLKQIVEATERRFPDYNGPFEYGTRLAEETGELIEALYETRGDAGSIQKSHLVRELLDVLRVTLGVAKVYGAHEEIPDTFAPFLSRERPYDLLGHIACVSIASGNLANAVNYAQGTGVKSKKHARPPMDNLQRSLEQMIGVIVNLADSFGLGSELTDEISSTLQRYNERGYI